MPTAADVDTRDWPVGVDFLGVTDDGVNWNLYYYQHNTTDSRTKTRTLEMWPPVAVTNDDGRIYIGILSNGFTVWENTEATLPDSRIA